MITLKKTGIFYKSDHRDKKEKKVKTVIPFLSEIIHIDKDFTLLDFFKLLKKNTPLYETVFSSALGHYRLDPFIKDVSKKFKGDDEDDMDRIEVYWSTDQWEFEGKNEVSVSTGTHGVGMKGKEKHCYAIEFTPLSQMKNMPIVLDVSFKMFPAWGENKKWDDKPVVQGYREFTVYDVFSSILYELSYSGSPEQRDNQWGELVETMEEAKEQIKKEEEQKSQESKE
jgi:hypothetical protein